MKFFSRRIAIIILTILAVSAIVFLNHDHPHSVVENKANTESVAAADVAEGAPVDLDQTQNQIQDCKFDAYVFDIGSGSSKSYKYEVDHCNENKKPEIKVVDDKVVHMQYQQCIKDSKLADHCVVEGFNSINKFKEHYDIDCAEQRCFGVATAWARNAHNSDLIIQKYKDNGINLKVINQYDEGRFTYLSIFNNLDEISQSLGHEFKAESLLVFDIGGGSHQVTYTDIHGEIKVFKGPYGNANFYEAVLEHFGEEYLYGKGKSSEQDFFREEAVPEVVTFAYEILEEELQQGITICYDSLIGVGRTISAYMIEDLGLSRDVSIDAIKQCIDRLSAMSQDQAAAEFNIGAPSFKPYMQSSLIMIYTIMKILEIDTLYIPEISTVDAIILDYLADRKQSKSTQ